jgi:hypothetical protein
MSGDCGIEALRLAGNCRKPERLSLQQPPQPVPTAKTPILVVEDDPFLRVVGIVLDPKMAA